MLGSCHRHVGLPKKHELLALLKNRRWSGVGHRTAARNQFTVKGLCLRVVNGLKQRWGVPFKSKLAIRDVQSLLVSVRMRLSAPPARFVQF